jgi:hypothetical protein
MPLTHRTVLPSSAGTTARRRLRPLLVALLLVLAGAVVALPSGADANVGYSQQVVMVGQTPAKVSVRFDVTFADYGNWYKRCFYHGHDAPPTCTNYGYRAAHGEFQTKLTTYKLKEGIKKYDYFLLDADTNVAKHSGSYSDGTAKVLVRNTGAATVDHTETKSIRASQHSCASLQLGISTPWPGVTASVPLGSVTLCDTNASFNRSAGSNVTTYTASRLSKINHLDTNRWTQVLAGKRPTFRVDVVVPHDTCTKYKTVGGAQWCQSFTNAWTTKTYYVKTTG